MGSDTACLAKVDVTDLRSISRRSSLATIQPPKTTDTRDYKIDAYAIDGEHLMLFGEEFTAGVLGELGG